MNSLVPVTAKGGKYLTFHLGEKSYAFSILRVKEIIEYGEVTPMPMMPAFIRGAINLRGEAVPVIDLALRLGLGTTEVARRTCIIVVEMEGAGETLPVGVMVDAVSRVLDLRAEEIEPAPTFGGHLRTDFIAGMGKVEGRFVVLLEIGRVLSMEDLRELSGAVAEEAV